jgi:ABC-type transport system substrate-binding protein
LVSSFGMTVPRRRAWIWSGLRMVDQKARRAVVWQMERILAHDLPYIPLLATGGTMAYSDRRRGVYPALSGHRGFFEQIRPAG